MWGGLREVDHVRWIMQGGLCKVGYARWITRGGLREVDYARYESPSELFHSLIFFHFMEQIWAISHGDLFSELDAQDNNSAK